MNPEEISNLTSIMSELLAITLELKAVIIAKDSQKNNFDEYVNTTNAQNYIKGYGIPMSPSKLYKLTSRKLIPFRKAGERLVFKTSELQSWCEDQLLVTDGCTSYSVEAIIKATHRIKNRKY